MKCEDISPGDPPVRHDSDSSPNDAVLPCTQSGPSCGANHRTMPPKQFSPHSNRGSVALRCGSTDDPTSCASGMFAKLAVAGSCAAIVTAFPDAPENTVESRATTIGAGADAPVSPVIQTSFSLILSLIHISEPTRQAE